MKLFLGGGVGGGTVGGGDKSAEKMARYFE